jgi:hypothetical protein
MRHWHFLDFQMWLIPLRQVEWVPAHDVKLTIPRKREDTYLISCHRYSNVQWVTDYLSIGNVRRYAGRAVGPRYMGEEGCHEFLMRG